MSNRQPATPAAVRPGARLLQQVLRGSGLSQAELARRTGIPRSVMNAYLRGGREPGGDTLAQIAAAGGARLVVAPSRPRVDPERAGRILVEVLELAEALPFRPRAELRYPHLPERIAGAAG